jgi:hypothetical protein
VELRRHHPVKTDAKESHMPALRFPTASKRRVAQTLAAALLVAGVVLIAVNRPSPVTAQEVAPRATPATASPTPDGFALPPALVESRESAYAPPTF